MSDYWFLVADAGVAKVFSGKRVGGELAIVKRFDHAESLERDQDLVADKAGNHQSSFGSGSFNEKSDAKELLAQEFARHVAQYLKENFPAKFSRLVVVAPVKFMGALLQVLDQKVQEAITQKIHKDYTHLSSEEISAHLEKARE